MFFWVPKMWGNDVGKQGAAWTAGKAILPILSSCVMPMRLRMEFMVTDLHMQRNTSYLQPALQFLSSTSQSIKIAGLSL